MKLGFAKPEFAGLAMWAEVCPGRDPDADWLKLPARRCLDKAKIRAGHSRTPRGERGDRLGSGSPPLLSPSSDGGPFPWQRDARLVRRTGIDAAARQAILDRRGLWGSIGLSPARARARNSRRIAMCTATKISAGLGFGRRAAQ